MENKKILIIYDNDYSTYRCEYIDSTIRAWDYKYNMPMYDGQSWAIVVADKKDIEFGVNILRSKIIEWCKDLIDEKIDMIMRAYGCHINDGELEEDE